MVTRPEMPDPPVPPASPAVPAAAHETIAARFEHASWADNSKLWLKRFAGLRFIGLIPLVGLGLVLAIKDRIADPTAVFALVLGATVANVLVMAAARRLDLHAQRAAAALLWISLAIDVAFVVGTASLLDSVRAPAAAFIVVPLLLATFACAERSTLALGALATLLLVLASVWSDGPRLERTATFVGAAALGWIVTLGSLWYRRRGRFLEERLRDLELRRAIEQTAPAPVAPRVVLNEAPARLDRSLAEVAHALAEDLREPTGVVRARSERLRFELRYRQNGDRTLVPELDRVLTAADRLDDVRLTLAALAGEDAAETHACDVSNVFRELRERLRVPFERDGVALRFEGSRLVRPVAASHNEVRLVLVRLLDAAHKAALGAGRTARVSIRAAPVAAGVVLAIRDQLKSPQLVDPEMAFHPDYSPPERPALGLALAVAKALVERRRGAVELEIPQRGGIAVRVTLPLAPDSATISGAESNGADAESDESVDADEARAT